MPIAKAEIGSVKLDDKIYIAAGFDGSLSPTNQLFVYTPALNSWDSSVSLPVKLHHLGMTTFNGLIYVMGGVQNGLNGPHPNGVEWTGTSTALEFNPRTKIWRKLKAIPHSTAASGVVAYGNKIYVIGGVDSNGIVLDLVQVYDPLQDSWSIKKPMSTKREHLGITVLDTLIYIVAGRMGNQSFKNLEAYSPGTNTWTTLPEMPTARSDIGFAVMSGKLWAMGGEKPGNFDITEIYDPKLRA